MISAEKAENLTVHEQRMIKVEITSRIFILNYSKHEAQGTNLQPLIGDYKHNRLNKHTCTKVPQEEDSRDLC